MTPDVAALFREVADLTAEERQDYYVRGHVPEALRAELESLLQYDVAGDSLHGYVASAERLLLDSTAAATGSPPMRTAGVVPDTIGRFVVTRLLGRGGMGEVYLARDPLIDRPVAIKLIGAEREDEAGRRRLVREARAAGRLHHPNIVTVFEVGEHDGRSYIAMEYVSGETVGSIIRRRAPLPLRQRLEMLEGACAGLAHAHREGVIHLDVKPDNLMVDSSGIVKVLDFGISRVLQSETLATMHGAGTLRYMSPEQIQGKPLDHRSDVFSLGCSVFEVVSYAPAFSGSTKEIVTQIASGPAPSLLDVVPHVDPRLDDIVGRAMALDPSERYDDLEQLRTDLAAVRAGIDPAQDVPDSSSLVGVAPEHRPLSASGSHARRTSRGRAARRRRWVIAGASGTAALAGIAAVLTTGGRFAPDSTPDRVPAAPVAVSVPADANRPTTGTGTPASAAEPSDEVWRQLARGDRAGVLQRMEEGGATANAALVSAVLDTVRTTVLRTRESAAPMGGATGSDTFRAGEQQLARANRLAANGQAVESLRAFWQAVDLYARSSAAATPAPLVSTAPPPSLSPSPSPSPATVEASNVASRVEQPAPPVVQPPAAPPAPIPATPVVVERAPLAAAAPPPPPQRSSDAEAIADTLRRYDAAYESLDVAALLRVFPSLGRPQVDQLRRTFAGMTAYEMDTRIADVKVASDSATVRATVARRMTPRVGNAVVNEVETEFRLHRSGSDWTIVGISAR